MAFSHSFLHTWEQRPEVELADVVTAGVSIQAYIFERTLEGDHSALRGSAAL